MKVNDWQNRYTVNCQENYHYFGEVKLVDNQFIASGTGLYYYTKDDCFTFMENHNLNTFDGMYFQRSSSDNSGNYFEAGFASNKKPIGPHLFFKTSIRSSSYNEKFELIYSELNENSLQDGPSVSIFPNNTFNIIKYVNGKPLDYIIRFEYGKLYLEKKGNATIIDILDCGWNFEPFYADISPSFCHGFKNKGIKPSSTNVIKTNNGYENLYYGALLTYNENQQYHIENNRHIFENEVYKYGIVELSNGKYFGEIKANGNKGDYYLHGFGCYKNNSECYLGYYQFNEKSYFGLLKRNDSTIFAQFENDQINGVAFEKRKNKLILATYQKGKKVNNYYEIDIHTFDVIEKDEKGNVLYKASFSNPKDKKDDTNKQEKISPNIKKILQHYNLTYVIEDNLDIYVTGSTLPKEKVTNLFIPNCVKGIKDEAFASYKNLKEVTILDGITYIGDGAFKNCENIEKVTLPKTIIEIGPYTFTSKRLEAIDIPFHVELIKNYAFKECKNLKYVKIENTTCVIEKYAFPEKIDHHNNTNTNEDDKKTNKINKAQKKEKREQTKAKAKEKIGDIFERIGIFFTKDIIKFFKTIGGFFIAIFGIIKEFFVETIPDFFKRKSKNKHTYKNKSYKSKSYGSNSSSFLEKIGDFFALIGKWIWTIICAPFKLIGSLFSGNGSILVVGAIIMGVYVVLVSTEAITIFGWNISWYIPKESFFGYKWELVNLGVDIFDNGGFFPVIFGLIFIVLGALIDFILYAILAIIIYAIPHIIQLLIQLIIVFVIPVCIPIGCIVALVKGESKGASLISLIITIVLTIIYFIFLSPLLK